MSVQAISAVIKVRGVSASEKLLLFLMANYANENGQTFVSHRRLAEDSGLSDRTVLTVLKSLEDGAFIRREQRQRVDGSRTTDTITLTFTGGETISPPPEIDDRGVGKLTTGGGEMVSPPTTFEPRTNRTTEPLDAPKRGTRLSESWTPNEIDIAVALKEGLTTEEIDRAAREFVNFWCAQSRNATKLSWPRTWANRVAELGERKRREVARMAAKPRVANGRDGGNASFADLFLQRHGQGQE